MGELFYLEFKTGENIEVQIEEPVGYDAVDFLLRQDSDRYGRDITAAGTDSGFEFKFTYHLHGDIFNKLVSYYNDYGFEGDVVLKIVIGNETISGNLDFETCTYNGHDELSLMMMPVTSEVLVKKRKTIKIDLFSDLNIDKEPTIPATSQNILLKSKETFEESIWENTAGDKLVLMNASLSPFNYSVNTTKTEIRNTLNWLNLNESGGNFNSYLRFELIKASESLRDLIFDIKFNSSKTIYQGLNGGSTGGLQMILAYGARPTTQEAFNLLPKIEIGRTTFSGSGNQEKLWLDKVVTVPELNVGQSVWIYFTYIYNSSSIGVSIDMLYKNIQISAKTFSSTYDTIVNAVSVYDAIKKIAKDTANVDIMFPLAETGALKSNYIFNGNLLRGKKDKPFNVSLEDIRGWFPELNMDYEVLSDDYDFALYVGNYKEFYTDNEIDVFPDIAIEEFTISTNLQFCLNKFSYRYDTYQAKKELTENGTVDNVHGEAEYHINNKQVHNEKSVSVGFVRDPFVMEAQRRIALTETDDTATQDDSTIFILDTQAAKVPEDYFKVYTGNLFHSIEGNPATMDMRLILRNSGDFRWDLLGLEVNGTFQIQSGANVGLYSIEELSSTQLKLRPGNSVPSNPQSGEFYTKYSFTLLYASFSLVNHTYNNGGTFISGIKSVSTYSNLRFTLKTNIDRYWKTWLATANLYGQNDIQNVEYKNNPEFKNNLVIPSVDEGGAILTKGNNGQTGLPNATPILSQHVIETKLIMPFEQFIRTTRLLRSPSRGYIRTFDVKGNAKYVYPTEMKAIHKASNLKEVTVKGELKYMPNEVNITKTNGMYNVWIHKLNELNFTQDGDYIQFKDGNGLNIYQRSNLFNTKVNGQQFITIDQLISALNAL